MDFSNVDVYSIERWLIYFPKLNLHYMERYISFCKSRSLLQNRKLAYVEKHHIIPKSIDKSLQNEKCNILNLSAREHYIAHWILMEAVGGCMIYAFHRLHFGKHNNIQNSRAYEQLRCYISKEQRNKLKGVKFSSEHINNIRKSKIGNRCSNETKHKISKANLGHKAWNKGLDMNKVIPDFSERVKNGMQKSEKYFQSFEKIRNANIGKITINNGTVCKRVNKDLLSDYINNGWVLGMLQTNKQKRITINNGVNNKLVLEAEVLDYINNGWKYGSITKGRKVSEEGRKKMSIARKNYCKNNKEKVLMQVKLLNERRCLKNGVTQ